MAQAPRSPGNRLEVTRARDPESVAEAIRVAAASGVGGAVEGLITGYHPIDIAFAMEQLDADERKRVFELLEAHQAGIVLEEIDNEMEQELVEDTEEEQLAEIIDSMPPDVGADVLSRMDDEQAQRVLDLMPDEESEEIEELLEHPEDSAGGLMTSEFIAVPEGFTAEQAVQHLRDTEVNPEGVAYVYVLDAEARLIGVVDVRVLVTEPPTARVSEFMATDLITVPPEADREEVVRIADRYDLLAVPVLDAHGRLLGAVTHDDVVDAISEEHTEDVLRMAGTDASALLSRSSFRAAIARVPWLAISLLGSICAASIIKLFHIDASAQGSVLLPLIPFIPTVTAMGGNSGLQSSTIVVRLLALGELRGTGIGKLFAREFLTAVIMGLICGVAVGIVGTVFFAGWEVGLIVGTSMLVAITWAATVGTFVPLLFDRIGADPALASGPLTTMLNDVFGLLIYFGLGTLMFHMFAS